MKTLKVCAVLVVILLTLLVVHVWYGGGNTPAPAPDAQAQSYIPPAVPEPEAAAPAAPPPEPPKPAPLTADEVKATFQNYCNGDVEVKDEQGFQHTVSAAQYWFDILHPVGTAKSLDVDEVALNTDDNNNLQTVGLELTLSWQGPLQEGSTTFKMLYEIENDQFTHIEVVRTDGVTRDDVDNFAKGYQLGAQIRDSLNGN